VVFVMVNKNVLAGLKCPECESEGPLRIATSCWVEATDDGIEDSYEHEWTGQSACVCVMCSYSAKIKDFEPKRKTSGNKKGAPKPWNHPDMVDKAVKAMRKQLKGDAR
jgi:hypothetical protein